MRRSIGRRPLCHGLFAAHVLVLFGACLAASVALPNQIQLPTVAMGTTQEHSHSKPSSSISRPCFLHHQAERLRVGTNLRGLLMKRGPVNSTDLCALSGYDISRVAARSTCLGWIPLPRQPKWFLRSRSHLLDTAPRCPDVSVRQQPSIPKAAAVNLKHGPTLRADSQSLLSVTCKLGSLKTLFADRKIGPVRSEYEMKHLLDTREFGVDDVYRQIRGNSATHEAVSGQHEVLQAIKARVESGSRPGHRRDKLKIALAIEGGGMRGCVSAGMAAAIDQLGLSDAFDAVYGSSAGALVATYFVAGGGMAQTHRFFQLVMENGKSFIDTARLLDLFRTPHCPNLKPVMSLDAISHIMLERESQACLDWQSFSARNQHQQLRIVATDLEMGQAVSLGSLEGAWTDPQSLMQCLKASCFLPGLAGSRPVDVKTNSASGTSPMVDALIYEPIPYRSAIEEGCTHILVLRTWPDEQRLPESFLRIFERILAPICLKHWPAVLDFMHRDQHSRVYAEDILRLNQGATGQPFHGAHILPIAVPVSAPISQMELDKNVVAEGILSGFSQACYMLAPASNSQRRLKLMDTLRRVRTKLVEDSQELPDPASIIQGYVYGRPC